MGQAQRIFIASDHAGFALKEELKSKIPLEWEDLGPTTDERVDYPDFASQVSKHVLNTPTSYGILICGTGIGMSIRANRYKGIRAALAWSEETARLSRAHNNANILCLSGRLLTPELCVRMVEIFLKTPFEGGRHKERVAKLDDPTSACESEGEHTP